MLYADSCMLWHAKQLVITGSWWFSRSCLLSSFKICYKITLRIHTSRPDHWLVDLTSVLGGHGPRFQSGHWVGCGLNFLIQNPTQYSETISTWENTQPDASVRWAQAKKNLAWHVCQSGLGQQKTMVFLARPKSNPIWRLNGCTHKKTNHMNVWYVVVLKSGPQIVLFQKDLMKMLHFYTVRCKHNTSFGLIVTVFCDSIDIWPVSVAFHFASLPCLRWFICAFRFRITTWVTLLEPFYSLQELLTLSSLTKLVNHSPTSGSTRNGKKVFMLHQWQLQEAAGV